jgi:acetyl-CoA synthetase
MNSEDNLFILYTSGTTGKPKGTVHVHGGFMMVAAQQTAYLIDMKASDTSFWYADWLDYWPDLGRLRQLYDRGNCFSL